MRQPRFFSFLSSIVGVAGMVGMIAGTPAGCGDDDAPRGPLRWAACGPLVPGGTDGECATMQVPLDWSAAEAAGPAGAAPTIDVLVKRFRGHGAGGGARGQLWFLDGGPGGTGAQFDNAELVALLDQLGWDLYIPAHRGTGRSTALTCAAAVAESSPLGALITLEEAAGCAGEVQARWGGALAHFSAEQAARDVGALIEASGKRPASGQRVAVWGGSYGTYWAQRYLQAFPAQADAVVLEGALDLTNRLSDQLRAGDAAGERFLDACAADATCARALGGAPRAAYDAAVRAIAAGACAPLAELTVPVWKQVARTLVDTGLGYDARAILAALVHRIDRCGAADAPVLERFVAGIPRLAEQLEREESDPTTNNFLLGLNEARVDLWPDALDRRAGAALHEGLRFTSAEEWAEAIAPFEQWPAQPHAADAQVPAVTGVPILVLSGGMDISTPLEWGALAASRYPQAQHVIFPTGGHGVSFDDALGDCALEVLFGFLAEPGTPVEASCVAAAPAIDFAQGAGARALWEEWLGTDNLWGD
jgi:pimeloyl-ACP methyl ester carboxylesterase